MDELQVKRIQGRVVKLPETYLVSDGAHEVRISASLWNKNGEARALDYARLALDRWAIECRDGKCVIHREA